MADQLPLALLGGTFDPVHYGHLRLADDVRTGLALSEIRLVPAGHPPHRGKPHASATDRLAMLDLACREFPALTIDPREIRRGGKSYTVLTLGELRSENPHRPLAWIVGADALAGLPQWHRWREIFDLAHLIVAKRPGARSRVAGGAVAGLECASHRRSRAPAQRALRRNLSAGSDAATDLGKRHSRCDREARRRFRAGFAPRQRFGLY